MLPFKEGVMGRLDEVYTFAKGENDYLDADGYKIAITALLGFTPTNLETDEVFKNRNKLNFQEFTDIVKYKLQYIFIDQYICDIFANFDQDFKGYVTIEDVYKAWKQLNGDLPWNEVEDAFKSISQSGTGILNYSELHDVLFCDFI